MMQNIGYKPLPMEKRIMCPSCGKVHMQMWTLPFDSVWHCGGCNNTIVADQRVIDWSKLVGTTIKSKFGCGNHATNKDDTMIVNAEVLGVRGNEVEILLEHDANPTWYTIYDEYVGHGGVYSGFHLRKVV